MDAVYAPRAIAPAADPRREVERALAEPVGAPPLGELARTARRVAVIIPDPTRGLPKELMLKAVGDALRAMADENITIVVAYGRHGREDAEDLGLPGGWERRFRVVHHDAFDAESHGRLSSPDDSELWFDLDRAVLDAEFVVGLGAVRPHYFAGFTGGAKLLMPGCASIATIRRNHALRTDRRARLGIVNGNRARENQEACAALHGRYVTLAAVTTERGELIRAAYGDAVRAHRALVPLARTLGQVDIEPVDIVVAGAAHPTSINIYQITKVVAPAARFARRAAWSLFAVRARRASAISRRSTT
ncbi:MAG: lactate racemase domain-containing protein [Deltaproteobacteria bacterium]|nr:lactate racemase domain-containing protein [Deltaproteobacteria bacterium]